MQGERVPLSVFVSTRLLLAGMMEWCHEVWAWLFMITGDCDEIYAGTPVHNDRPSEVWNPPWRRPTFASFTSSDQSRHKGCLCLDLSSFGRHHGMMSQGVSVALERLRSRFFSISREPQTSRRHVTSALAWGLQFEVHVCTSRPLSCGKWFTARFFSP